MTTSTGGTFLKLPSCLTSSSDTLLRSRTCSTGIRITLTPSPCRDPHLAAAAAHLEHLAPVEVGGDGLQLLVPLALLRAGEVLL